MLEQSIEIGQMVGKHPNSNIHLVIKEIALTSVKMGNTENEVGLYKNN